MNWDAFLEAEKRGILPPEKQPLLAEARKRGLVPGSSLPELRQAPSTLPTGQFALPETEQMTSTQRQLIQGGFDPRATPAGPEDYRPATGLMDYLTHLGGLASYALPQSIGGPLGGVLRATEKTPQPWRDVPGVGRVLKGLTGERSLEEAGTKALRQAKEVSTLATAEETQRQAEALAKQQTEVANVQEELRLKRAQAQAELPAELEQIREQAQKDVLPDVRREMVEGATGRTREQTLLAPLEGWEETPQGTTLPGPARTAASRRNREVLFAPYDKVSADLRGQYAAIMKEHGETPVRAESLRDVAVQEAQYAAEHAHTFPSKLQDLLQKADSIAMMSAAGKEPGVAARQVFGLQSEASELLKSAGLSGTDKTAVRRLIDESHNILQETLPISPDLKESYRMMRRDFDPAFMRAVSNAATPQESAQILYSDIPRGVQLTKNMTPDQKATARFMFGEWYNSNPQAALKAEFAPIQRQIFGEQSPLANIGSVLYTNDKIEALGQLVQQSPAVLQKMEGLQREAVGKLVQKLADNIVTDSKNWLGKLQPAQASQLRRELAALPDNTARAERIVAFFSGNAPEREMMNLALTHPDPASVGPSAIAKKFPGGLTPQTGQTVEPATTPTQAAEQAVRMGPPKSADPWWMQHIKRVGPYYATFAGARLLAGQSFPMIGAELAGMKGAEMIVRFFRNGFAKTMEDPAKAARFVEAMQAPGRPNNLRTIVGYGVEAAVREKARQLSASQQDLSVPPAPPQAPLPDTERKERRDTAKDWRTEVHEGTEGPDITPDLNAGRATLDDARALLVPVTP